MRDKLDLGHALYMDNYYNSFDLSKELFDQKTYTISRYTLRAKRKNIPSDVVETKLVCGESVFLTWTSKNKRGETTMKPTAIVEYKYMKGVDRQD
ncbi:hypothetical protein J6590_089177 [Homalodisca vitripennis]|nr:hypothetical protein J6590_089177 [Homalodisca vitripennis]